MLRELIEKEASAVRSAVHAVRGWLHLSKDARPEGPAAAPPGGDVERREEPPESKPMA